MRRPLWSAVSDRPAWCRRTLPWLLVALAAPGCGGDPRINFTSVSEPPTVRLVHPTDRNIVRVVGQPSFIESYERTSVFPKMSAYIEKWIVDIGDKVKKGDVLATLFVPELVEDFGTKKATVQLEKDRIELARKMVEVADADVASARAQLDEARAILGKYEAEVKRWDSQVKRLAGEVERQAVAPQILLESTNELNSSIAARDAAKAAITSAQAVLLSREAALAKAKVDVTIAGDDLAVASSEESRLRAWVGYLTLNAPFDGVIVVRNANTFDFVLPATGDPTAMQRSPDLSPGRAAPIYVVDRIDVVRIFVDIPEQDANYVQIGTKATVLARAFRDQELPASVTRTSWALNVTSRTLRAEIDLPNPDSRLLPGMYAYGKVVIERPGVRALPMDALVYEGDRTFCWRYEDGRALRTELETGVNDGEWIEVTNRRIPASHAVPPGEVPWTPFTGSEQVIRGDLSILTEGVPVRVAPPRAGAKVAGRATPATDPTGLRSGAIARSR
jgi:multidrug efflux pump subunit AcrA (membrane-fusion protein)